MEKKFTEILKKYLILNEDKKVIGYTEEEIKKIEKLYDIEIKEDFREFLNKIGRYSGNLLGDEIILYNEMWDVNSYMNINYFFLKLKLKETPYDLKKIIKTKPFIFAIEYETNYIFIKTIDNDLKLYCFDETKEKILETNLTFDEYLLKIIENDNPNLVPLIEEPMKGELLPKYDKNSGKEIYSEEIKKYIEKNNKTEDDFIWILEKYLKQNNKTSVGYSEIEIEEIEKLYKIKIKSKFKEFMKFCGRSSGGLLTGNELIFYKNWDIRNQWLYENEFREKLIDGADPVNLDGNFVLKEEGNQYFFFKSKKAGLAVYCFDYEKDEVMDINVDFNEYLVNLVKKYNPELKPLKNGSLKGELIKID